MQLPNLHISDYELTFEGAGVTFLYNYALGRYYWPVDTFMVVRKGAVQEFVSRRFLKQMDAEGLSRTPLQVDAAIMRMRESVTEGAAEIEKILSAPLTKESMQRGFNLCAQVMSNYYYFDPHFWDSVFEKAQSDQAAKEIVAMVQTYKNVARDEYNSYFFGDGHLSRLLLKLSALSGVPVTDLAWYDSVELYDLFEDTRVPREEIANRQEIFVVVKIDGQATVYTGSQGKALADTFYAGERLEYTPELRGRCAHKTGAVVRGRVCNITRDYNDTQKMHREMDDMNQGDILVTQTTDPEMMPALRKAAAAVTDIGGLLSHTAITARELNIPCVVGTKIATQIFKGGDMVEVDAEQGIVRKI